VKRTRFLALLLAFALVAAACGDDDDGASTETTDAAGATTTAAAGGETTAAPDGTEATATTAADGEAESGGASGFDIDAVLAADLDDCEPPPTGEPLKLGFAADLSDLGGFADLPASQAAQHFIDLINCTGGVNGTPLELTVQNIEGDPEVTQRAAQDLVDAGVQAILGPPFADFGQPLLQVTQGQVPVLFVASTEPTLPDVASLAYLVAFDDTAQATAAAEFALDQGWQNAVTFSSPGPYFGYNPEVFTEVFEAGGGTVLGDYNFVPIDDVDFSTQVNEIASLETPPDVVYTAMLAFQAAPLAEQLAAAGVDTNFLITDAFEATGGYFTDGTEGFYHTTHSFPAEGSRVKILDDSFAAATGAPLENPSFGGLAADSIAVVIDAFLRSGSTDPAEIGAAIAEGTGIEGVTGVLSYDGGATPTKPVYVHQVVNGEPSLAATIGG
jgi:ABC-type branched-subunit amino acid transport system substrate-binding protein